MPIEAYAWCTNKFGTNLVTGELADVAGSFSEGCRTNAITSEEPRRTIMTKNGMDMVL